MAKRPGPSSAVHTRVELAAKAGSTQTVDLHTGSVRLATVAKPESGDEDLLATWTHIRATVDKSYEKLAGWQRQCSEDEAHTLCGLPAVEALSRRCPAVEHWLNAEKPLQGYHVMCISSADGGDAATTLQFNVRSMVFSLPAFNGVFTPSGYTVHLASQSVNIC